NINPTVTEYLGQGSAATALGSEHSENVREEQLLLELRNEWTTSTEFVRTTDDGVTAFSLALVFPQGLWALALHGDHVKLETRLVVKYRPTGTLTWTTLVNQLYKEYNQNPIVKNVSKSGLDAGQYDVSVQLVGTDRDYYTKDRGGSGSLVSVFVG